MQLPLIAIFSTLLPLTLASRWSFGHPSEWTPKQNHCLTKHWSSPLISDCIKALHALPIQPGAQTPSQCGLSTNKEFRKLSDDRMAQVVQHYITGKHGTCGVSVYDMRGFNDCPQRIDVDAAVWRVIEGCKDGWSGRVEGWTDVRNGLGSGRRLVQVYPLVECGPGEGGREREKCIEKIEGSEEVPVGEQVDKIQVEESLKGGNKGNVTHTESD